MHDEAWRSLQETALALADAAGAAIRPHFRRPIAVDTKPDASPVTAADREAEAAMRAILEARHPEHGVIGEEFGADHVDAEWLWVLDPIDGTRAFISGAPTFGTLIALLHDGRPLLGVIDQPISRERWVGGPEGTSHNGSPVQARSCEGLTTATLFATAPDMFPGDDAARFRSLAAAVRQVRYGLDCYAYGLLALGFVDLVVESSLQPYDYLALAPIVAGAGGVITDWQGRPLHAGSDGRVLAAGDERTHWRALVHLTGAESG